MSKIVRNPKITNVSAISRCCSIEPIGFDSEGRMYLFVCNIDNVYTNSVVRELRKYIPIHQIATGESFNGLIDTNLVGYKVPDNTRNREMSSIWLSPLSPYTDNEVQNMVPRLIDRVEKTPRVLINRLDRELQKLSKLKEVTTDDYQTYERLVTQYYSLLNPAVVSIEGQLRMLMGRISDYLNDSSMYPSSSTAKFRLIRSKVALMKLKPSKLDIGSLIMANLSAPEVILTQLIMAKHFGKLDDILTNDEFDSLYAFIKEIHDEWEANLGDLKTDGKKPYTLTVIPVEV